MKFVKNYDKNLLEIDNILPVKKSFDIVKRTIDIDGKRASLYFVDGFAKDDIMLWINEVLQSINLDAEESIDLNKFINKNIAYIEVDETDDINQLCDAVLVGMTGIVIEGYQKAVLIDCRTYPARSTEEPDLEKITRGSRDGFVETLVFNTALVRRRIRDYGLVFEILSVGKRTKTDVVIGYIDGVADMKLKERIQESIENATIESLVMNEKSLEEHISSKKWYNPFPNVRYTERPDVVAAHLIEGHIVIIIDNSPSAMILPTTIFYFIQHAEDYIQNPLVGNYIRFIRYILLFSSFLLIPTWYMITQHVELLPDWLAFIGPRETNYVIPIFFQFLMLEIGLDGLRIASIHTPNTLSTSLGIIGGLILSQFAIDVGWFLPETILYMAIVALGQYATPSIEFSYAIRIFRLVLLILTGIFNIYGYIVGLILVFIVALRTNTIGGINYLWPLIPFNPKALGKLLFRKPITKYPSQK